MTSPAARALPVAAVLALVMLALLGGSAGAERSQEGNLIVALNGGITPRELPRHRPVPVVVHLAGRALTSDSSPLPRVNWIRLELAWRGVLDTQGLAVCPRARLIGKASWQAYRACRPALVGRGGLDADVFIPNQKPFEVHAKLLAFNGKTKVGRPAVLVHAFAPNPPVSFVIPFSVHHRKGAFRTVLITMIRKTVGPWPHVANFDVAISRSFTYKGRRHSYVSASCPVPKSFTAGFLSFARATYTFEGGKQIATESVRSCRAREAARPLRR
jgi:hypothetical protein